MFKNRSIKLSLIKDPAAAEEQAIPTVDVEEIEEIARRSAVDFAKLVVAAVGSLMVLHTALEITEHHATKE